MNIEQMHIMFKVLVDKNDTISTPNFLSEEVDLFLNLAIKQFSKDRYSGNNPKRTAFEQSEKRRNDLKNLISRTLITTGEKLDDFRPNHRFFALPTSGAEKYWLSLAESVRNVIIDCNTTQIKSGEVLVSGTYYVLTEGSATYNGTVYTAPDYIQGNGAIITLSTGTVLTKGTISEAVVFPITLDQLSNALRDPFNKPSHNSVLRLTTGNYAEIIGSKDFISMALDLRYFRQPIEVSYDGNVDCDLSESVHEEIVRIAVQIALEPIESRRYSTIQNEINKQE